MDITFTTRTTFNEESLSKLKSINEYMKNKNRKLIASISISRLSSANYLEPYPIPSAEDRIETLKKLKQNGFIYNISYQTIFTSINANEYIEIIKKSKDYIDAVLGKIWYANDKLINDVCKNIDNKKIKFIEKTWTLMIIMKFGNAMKL